MRKTIWIIIAVILTLPCLTAASAEEANREDSPITARPGSEAFEPWICPDCSRENEPDSAFCPWCGLKKPEDPPAFITCPACGEKYDPDMGYLYCRKCGAKLTAEEENPTPPPAPKDPNQEIQGTWRLTDARGTDTKAVKQLTDALASGYVLQYTFLDGRFLASGIMGTQETGAAGIYRIHDGNQINIHQDYYEFGEDWTFLLEGDTMELTKEDNRTKLYYTMILTREYEN